MSDSDKNLNILKDNAIVLEAISLVNQYGDSVDLSVIFDYMTLSESIHSPFCKGKIMIDDSINLLRSFRMTGQEFVNVQFKNSDDLSEALRNRGIDDKNNFCSKNFRVFKIVNTTRPQVLTETYEIHLCDPYMMEGLKKKISKVFRGSYSEIAKKIFTKELGVDEKNLGEFFKSDPENVQFISPNWNVNSIIDFCTENADTAGDACAYHNSFFCFSTVAKGELGGYRFQPLHNLISNRDSVVETPVFSYRHRGTEDLTNMPYLDEELGYATRILNYKKPSSFNTLRGLMNGAYSSSVNTFDPISKISKNVEYSIVDNWNDEHSHVSPYPMIHEGDETIYRGKKIQNPNVPPEYDTELTSTGLSNSPSALKKYDFTMPHAYTNKTSLSDNENFVSYKNDVTENNQLQRLAMMEQLQQNFITVEVTLRADVHVGQVVKLDIPPAEMNEEGTDQLPTDMNDGFYLITDAKFVITGSETGSKLILECVKESFAKKVSEYDPGLNKGEVELGGSL